MMLGSGNESVFIVDVVFWMIALLSIATAIAVIQVKDLFRAALFLAACFLSIAALFVLLRSEFLAVIQLLIYVGAISVLTIFVVLTTKDVEHGNPSNMLRVPAALLTTLFFVTTSVVLIGGEWNLIENAIIAGGATSVDSGQVQLSADTLESIGIVFSNSIPNIADLLLQDFVIVFEVASVLLLAAVIGALALVRGR
tara:strand:+ start:15642 stop:16232 length:591 start_codon:yes stop_codon:yes gene_type:complete